VATGCRCDAGHSGNITATSFAPLYYESKLHTGAVPSKHQRKPGNTGCSCRSGLNGTIAPSTTSPFYSGCARKWPAPRIPRAAASLMAVCALGLCRPGDGLLNFSLLHQHLFLTFTVVVKAWGAGGLQQTSGSTNNPFGRGGSGGYSSGKILAMTERS